MQTSLPAAVATLQAAVAEVEQHSSSRSPSGVVRLQLQLPATFSALQWLITQSASERLHDAAPAAAPLRPLNSDGASSGPTSMAQPKTYFSPRQAPHPANDPEHNPTIAGAAPLRLLQCMLRMHVMNT